MAVKGACDQVEMRSLTALLAKIRPAVDDEHETKRMAHLKIQRLAKTWLLSM